jgi:hypothetical protein
MNSICRANRSAGEPDDNSMAEEIEQGRRAQWVSDGCCG